MELENPLKKDANNSQTATSSKLVLVFKKSSIRPDILFMREPLPVCTTHTVRSPSVSPNSLQQAKHYSLNTT